MEMQFGQAYHQKLSSYIAAGKVPDVVYMWPGARDSSKILHDNKLMKDLNAVLGKDFLSNFNATALDVNLQGSKQLSLLPQSFTYCGIAYVNKRILADAGIAVPKTYTDLKKMVLKLRAKNVQTVLLPDGDQWPAESCLFSTMVGRYLGDAWLDQVKIGKVKFTDRAFVNVLTQYQKLYEDGIIQISNVQMGIGEGPALFAAGKAAIIFDGDWHVGAYLTDASTGKALIPPAVQKSDIVLINIPAFPGEKFPGAAAATAGVGLGISKDCSGAKLEAAKKLLEFYYGKEFQTMKWETGAYVPTRKGLKTEKLEPLSVKLSDFYAANTKACYVIDGVIDPNVYNILNVGLQAIPLGAKTPAQVAKEMQDAQNKLLKK
jgi:raffinose/stachyose/melibiose transport system substrate-binding protein